MELKVNQSNSEVKYNIFAAIKRIERGAMYGDDMKSSAWLCYADAITLLEVAANCLKKEIEDGE